MLSIVHLIVGAALGKTMGIFALPIAFISHYVLDAIPHYNPKPVKDYKLRGLRGADKKDIIVKSIEPIAGMLIVLTFMTLYPDKALIILLGAFFSIAPDIILFLSWRFGDAGLLEVEHIWHHHSGFVVGMIPQVLVFTLSFALLIS